MKRILSTLAIISILAVVSETIQGRIDGAILFSVWSFYLRYLSDKRE